MPKGVRQAYVKYIKLVGQNQEAWWNDYTDELNVKFYCEEDEIQTNTAGAQMTKMARGIQGWVGSSNEAKYSEIDFELNARNSKQMNLPSDASSPMALRRDCKMGKPITMSVTEKDYLANDYGEQTMMPAQYLMNAAE